MLNRLPNVLLRKKTITCVIGVRIRVYLQTMGYHFQCLQTIGNMASDKKLLGRAKYLLLPFQYEKFDWTRG